MTFGQLKGSKLIKYILHIFCSLTTFQKKGLSPDQACFITVARTMQNIATIRRKRLPQVLVEEQWEDINPRLHAFIRGWMDKVLGAFIGLLHQWS